MLTLMSLKDLKFIIQNNKNVVVKFYTEHCIPCKSVKPIYERISISPQYSEFKFVDFLVLDSDVSTEYGMSSSPTVIVFNNQKEMARLSGVFSQKQLELILSTTSKQG
jgi:thiol-disulfide isomerase/thioredoxin